MNATGLLLACERPSSKQFPSPLEHILISLTLISISWLKCRASKVRAGDMSDAQSKDATRRRAQQRTHACNECKRRKVRCSGDDRCANCVRDGKQCQYSSSLNKVPALERRLASAEHRLRLVQRAWDRHLPHVNLDEEIRILSADHDGSDAQEQIQNVVT